VTDAPRVSVGIPFFDEERRLGDAVRSILAQTVTDIEILLVDDGSRDRSLEIARSFGDPRVVVLSDGVRRHLPARLNVIARRARAPLVARMDADDVSHPDRLARELSLLDHDPSLDAVGSWVGIVDDRDVPLAVSESNVEDAPLASRLVRAVIVHATMLARRDWLLANPYDESLTRSEDRDLFCRTRAGSRMAVVPEVLYVVRTSTGGDFLADYLESQEQQRQLFLRYGPEMLGWRRTAVHWLASHGKGAVMRAATWTGQAGRLVRRRGRAPTDAERARIATALQAGRAPHSA
jgi:glycosyltransferase involved in cell wall biosynthesis